MSIPLRQTTLCLVLVILMGVIYCNEEFIEASPVSQMQKPTLIQANHFYSSKNKSVSYNVVHLNQQLPVFVIPKNYNQTRQSYSNRINITLNDSKGNYISCMLEDNFQLCVLDKFNAETLIMYIQCDTLPCEFSWNMLQTPIEKINTTNIQKSSLKELYEIQQSQQHRHLTIKVSCDNTALNQQFHNTLQFYANKQNYHIVKSQGLTYYLFKNPPTLYKEYFYIRINEKYRECAQVQIYNQQRDLKTNELVNDFALAGQSVNYNLISLSTDMRLDANVHFFSQSQTLSGQFNIKLVGKKGSVLETIRSMSFEPKKKKQIEFSFVLNNISSHEANLSLVIESSEVECLLRFSLRGGEVQEVQKGEYSFLSMKRGQKIQYELIRQRDASPNEKVHIFASNQRKVNLSRRECDAAAGCRFQVVAEEDFDGSIYLGQAIKEDTEQVVTFAISKSFSKRVPQDTTIYLRKQMQEKKSYQVLVNTHNVILYAAKSYKCKVPSETCHQRAANSHHPFIYESDEKGALIIAVHSLDECEFTVTIIEQNGEYPELKDGVPFAYLMDENQDDVIFKFNLHQKDDLTFSLVAPINQLALYIFQDKQPPTDYEQHAQFFSLDGYVNIKKTKLTSHDFIVIVRKLDPKSTQFLHFTLIAATKNSNIKLQTGVTHHEKLTPKQHQDFVLQFDPSIKYVLNFYLHDSVGQPINLSLELSKNDSYTGEKSHLFDIEGEIDEIDITEKGRKVCELEGTSSCQVFMRVTNRMGRMANMQITLLTMNSIVELHDGVWQYFAEELVSTTTNFYFSPKHSNNPVNIFYNSNNPDMRILYQLRKIDSKLLNLEQWQFPNISKQMNNNQGLNLRMRQVKHISIGKQSLNICSPNCLLLITLIKSPQVKDKFQEIARNKQFGILVSNNIIEIPEKTRLEVTIENGESKYMKMSMKNVFEQDALTCYIHTSLGSVSVFANACSDKRLRMPTNQDYDFSFGFLQTQLRSSTIKQRFEQSDIDQNENPSLCLVIVSNESSKFSIEYTSEEEIVSLLRPDEFKTVELGVRESRYFQIEASLEGRVKVVRNKGFPFVDIQKCTGGDLSYQQCLEQLQSNEKQINSQIIQKVKRYQYEPCEKCIVYLKIYSEQPAQIDLHLESKYSEIILQEKKITTDFIQKGKENKYQLTSLSNQHTFITINVIEGNVLCKVTDLQSINISKQSDSKQRNLHFSITPAQFEESKNGLVKKSFQSASNSLFSGFGLQRLFTTVHISIECSDKSKSASYTIQYSSGEREYYLQNGLVSSYKLQGNNPNGIARFYYENQNPNSGVYLFLGSEKSSQLSKLIMRVYSMDGEGNQQSKKQIVSKMPSMRKKSEKPTILYPLPQGKFYLIEISNPTGAEMEFSIGVNNQQVIFLPYDIDYPLLMVDNQTANFIVDPKTKGYILLSLKKCDQSQGQISYTFDYESFLNKEYQFTSSLNTDPKFQYLVKIDHPSPLYITIKKNQPDPSYFDTELHNSLFSLSARFSNQKMTTTDFIKPGNNGQITYEVLSDNKVKIQFYQVTCESKNRQFCTENFEYFLIASDKMIDVYSQSVCPSTYFVDLQNIDKREILPLRKILEKPSNGKVSLEYKFEKNSPLMYVAVKAVFRNKENERIEVYYRPIEVVSLWGKVQKASGKFGIRIVVGVMVLFCVFLVCLRRQRRKGYQSLHVDD